MNHMDWKVVDLVQRIEEITKGENPALVQKALGSALWRTVSQHPTFRSTLEFTVDGLRLSDGGSRLKIEVDVSPGKTKDEG